ncbi:MAG: molecular chaperone HtpG [Bacteroides sp.]|nr:molecular chaperone HtpG [Bacteroides sp.]
MQKGSIGVKTENIFPIIKKFLYSDHEIFLRELVSNAVDATQKLKTLSSIGEFKGELGDLTIKVKVEDNTIRIIDRGIGLTAEEIEKYINQIAFSGANDFLEKYKNDANAIIGHFGLGFYSAFMVANRVDIITKSHKEGSQAVKWSCDGSPEYTIENVEKEDRGTEIVLHIEDEDSKEFLKHERIQALLDKYCSFLAIPVAFGNKKEWKEGKQVETDELNIINDTTPIWASKPSDLKDEDYKSFYQKLYPMSDEPLFWIHLNVDYPFNLTGILYFPKIKNNIELTKNKIQLYCNQVYVTDSVEGIVPDFLTLLHGVIDSPDIPLNVSRSYLQSDSNVKKISSYITKKVSDRLQSIFKNDRQQFEEKWNSLKIFINYGMLTQEDFFDKAKNFTLLTDTEGKHYTLDEYKQLISGTQTDKNNKTVYLYANDKEAQFAYIDIANSKGYNVLLMDGQLDVPTISMLEQKLENVVFTRVDSDTIDRLIAKEEHVEEIIDFNKKEAISSAFESQIPSIDKVSFSVNIQAMGDTSSPIIITQSEYMRRMKEMANIQAGMSFYGEMPDMYSMVLNSDHKIIKSILEEQASYKAEDVKKIDDEIEAIDAEKKELEKDRENNKEKIAELESKAEGLKNNKNSIFREYAKDNKVIKQLIDLSLLQNNMLRGEELNKFIKRSFELI